MCPPAVIRSTLGCGKFRLINQDFGTLAGTGLPRLLDMGQCNDAYSALVRAWPVLMSTILGGEPFLCGALLL